MTILTMNRRELEKRVGKIDAKLEKAITDMGTPVEEICDSEVEVEVFPNRPDLLSLENFARALNQFNGKGKIAKFRVSPPEKDYEVVIDKSVKNIRPHSVCAIIKGLKFDDAKIKSVIEFQEKLHGSYGRNRKKLALGIYPLETIKFPLKYRAEKPENIKFRPLDFNKVINGKQILTKTSTGRDYAKLIKGEELFPVYRDATGAVLSMPPIINSYDTGRITEKTRNIFIECSGFNLNYLKKTIDLVCSSFVEMGGRIFALKIMDEKGSFNSPSMKTEDMEFKLSNIEKTLGISLDEKNIKKYLARMGIGIRKNEKGLIAEIPCYRTDILHWIDLTEEIAIAYGYDNFIPEIPKISTIAEENSFDKGKRIIGNILAGLGFLECNTFHLTTKKNVKKMHYDFKDWIELESSKTERDVLRFDLITNLLQILNENSNASYPQKIFEMGKIFNKNKDNSNGVVEKEKLAILMIDEKMGYTEIKQVTDYLFKMLGLKYRVEDIEDSNYILGRVGKVIIDDNEVGRIGEIAPRVLKNWKIRMPTVGFEIELEKILQ